jgi:hypothetical protein
MIPVIFNIHVEPDERIIPYQKKRWLGYENLHTYFNKLRPQFEKATKKPVKFNWLFRLDPQIKEVYGSYDWALKNYSELVDESLTLGDDFGVHIHSWRPHRSWFKKSWIADFSDELWIENCVKNAHQAFYDHFNFSPTYFSFGDHFMTDRLLTQLEDLGFRCDVTMHPNRPRIKRFVEKELSVGFLPGFENTPRKPFKPSYKDFTKPIKDDERRIWQIPITVASSKTPDQDYPEKLLLGIPFDKIPKIIEDGLSLPYPYLLAEMRTDVRMDKYNCTQFELALEYLLHHPSVGDINFLGMNQFIDHLESTDYKSFDYD